MLFFTVKEKWKLSLLFFFSVLFLYFNSIISILIALLLTTVNFYILKKIERSKQKKLFYSIGIFVNLISLLLFNYLNSKDNFFTLHFEESSYHTSEFILWIGISFYSIQHIQILRDYRRGKIIQNLNFLEFFTSSLYFPKIIAGPIQSTENLVTQFRNWRWNKSLFFSGVNRFVLGIFKKVVIADRLSLCVHSLFDFNDEKSGLLLLVSGFLFTIQLYFDFSGYCDMAIGTSRLFCISIDENFNLPFRAISVSEFWRKWHITLMKFINENVYFPLAYRFRKLKKTGIVISLLITFLISGLWHGIGTGFLLWASCHALYLILEYFILPYFQNQRLQNSILFKLGCGVITFLLISFSNVFFRSLDGKMAIKNLFSFFENSFFPNDWYSQFWAKIASGGMMNDYFNLSISLIFATVFLFTEVRIQRISNDQKIRLSFLILFISLILCFGVFDKGERFIYMQF